MIKFQKSAICLLALLGTAAAAHAGRFIETPLFAPIPTERPAADEIDEAGMGEAAVKRLRRPVVSISVEPQAIPPSRLNVRVIGVRFLPDQTAGMIRLDETPAQPGVLSALATETPR